MGAQVNQREWPSGLGEMACKYLARCSNLPILQYLKWIRCDKRAPHMQLSGVKEDTSARSSC